MKIMHKLLTLALAACLCLPLSAQTPSYDTTEISLGSNRLILLAPADGSADDEDAPRAERQGHDDDHSDGDDKKKKPKSVDVDFIRLDIGMNFLLDNGDFNLGSDLKAFETSPLGSTHLGWNFLSTRISLIRSRVNLITGITLDNNRYAFTSGTSLLPGQDTLTWVTDSAQYKRNKLVTNHLQIPLLLNFQTKPGQDRGNFHLSVGGYAGLLIGAHTKQKTDGSKLKVRDDFNMEKFRYGLTARVGYGGFEIYANYDLVPMFHSGDLPNRLSRVTFGVTVMPLI